MNTIVKSILDLILTSNLFISSIFIIIITIIGTKIYLYLFD